MSDSATIGSVLITGGAGFFGQHFARRLLDQRVSDRICILSRNEWNQARMRQELGDDSRLRWFIGDVRDTQRLFHAMHRIDYVVHAAALKRIEVGRYNPMEMVQTNIIGTMNVVQVAREAGVRRAVLLSSDKAYHPISPYGHTKALAEMLFMTANGTGSAGETDFRVTRYGNVAGSTGSIIPTLRHLKSRGGRARISSVAATRFWMMPHQAVDMVLHTMLQPNIGPLLIPTLPAFRLLDLLAAMDFHDYDVVGLPAWEKLHESMDEHQTSDAAPRLSVDQLREMLRHV